MFRHLRDIPSRLATGAYILHSGLEKWNGSEEQAKAVQQQSELERAKAAQLLAELEQAMAAEIRHLQAKLEQAKADVGNAARRR